MVTTSIRSEIENMLTDLWIEAGRKEIERVKN
jgi:hypothetical protein